MRFRAFSASIVSRASFSKIVAVQISYVVLVKCSQWINSLIISSNRFSNSRVPGAQNWYPRIYSSKESAFIARFNKSLDDIRCNSLLKALDRQYAFDDSVNYNALGIDNIVVSPNLLVYVQVTSVLQHKPMQFSNSRSSTIFGMYSSFSEVELCRLSDTIRNILITDRFSSINRPARDIQYFVGRENMRQS